jgi:hypothetical protein
MILPDVNVLVYAFSTRSPEHERYRSWLDDELSGEAPIGISDIVLSGLVRIATHPRIFRPPASMEDALAFADSLRAAPNAVRITPGDRHWDTFARLCRDGSARGNLVSDAFIAALAIDSGSELITTDRDFARFPGLRWRHPLA